MKLWGTAQGRLIDQLATSDALTSVAFVDANHVIAGGDHGHLELFELAPSRPNAEILQRARASPRWMLDHGRAVERR